MYGMLNYFFFNSETEWYTKNMQTKHWTEEMKEEDDDEEDEDDDEDSSSR